LLANIKSESEKCNRDFTDVTGKLDKTLKMIEKSQRKIQLVNEEKLHSDQAHDALLQELAAAKAKKVLVSVD